MKTNEEISKHNTHLHGTVKKAIVLSGPIKQALWRPICRRRHSTVSCCSSTTTATCYHRRLLVRLWLLRLWLLRLTSYRPLIYRCIVRIEVAKVLTQNGLCCSDVVDVVVGATGGTNETLAWRHQAVLIRHCWDLKRVLQRVSIDDPICKRTVKSC